MIFQWYSALWTGVSTQKQGVASTQKSALFYTFLGADLHKNKGSSTQNLPPIYTKNAVSESPIFMPEWMYLHKSCRQSTRSASFSLKLTHVPVSSVLQNVYPPELLFPDTIRAGERKETDFAVFGLAALIYQYLYGYFTSHKFCVDRPRFLCRYPDFSAVKLLYHTSIGNACFVAGFCAFAIFAKNCPEKREKRALPAGRTLSGLYSSSSGTSLFSAIRFGRILKWTGGGGVGCLFGKKIRTAT